MALTNPNQIVSRAGTPYRFRPGVQTDPVDPFAEDSRDPDAGFAPVGSAGTNQPGTWVPGSFASPGGISPWKLIAMMAGPPVGTTLNFASFMHPEGKTGAALRYGAMGAGIAESVAGFYGAGGAPGRASLPQVQSGLPSYLQPTAGTTAAFGWPAASNLATTAGTGGGMGGVMDFIGGLGNKNMLGNRVSIMDLIDVGGDIAGKWSAGRQADRVNQAGFNMLYDQAELERYKAALLAAQADINQREYSDTRYDTDTDRRLRGSMLQNIQDPTIARPEGVPTVNVSGGLRPSMFTNRADVGRDLERQATIDMLNPPKLPGIPTPPPASRVDEAGGADKALDILSLIGGGVGLFNDLLGDQPAATPGQVTKKGPSATAPTYDPNALSRPSTWNTGLGPLTLRPGATTAGATNAAASEPAGDPFEFDLSNLQNLAPPPTPRAVGSGATPAAAASRAPSGSSGSTPSGSPLTPSERQSFGQSYPRSPSAALTAGPSTARPQSYINEPSQTALSAIYGDTLNRLGSPGAGSIGAGPRSPLGVTSAPPLVDMGTFPRGLPDYTQTGPLAGMTRFSGGNPRPASDLNTMLAALRGTQPGLPTTPAMPTQPSSRSFAPRPLPLPREVLDALEQYGFVR